MIEKMDNAIQLSLIVKKNYWDFVIMIALNHQLDWFYQNFLVIPLVKLQVYYLEMLQL